MTLSLLPGSSGSAARDLPGLYSMKAEIGKRKLDLLSRIINSRICLAYRKLFARRLIKWKWKTTILRNSFQTLSKTCKNLIFLVILLIYLRITASLPLTDKNKDGNQLSEMLLTKRNICNGSIRSVANLAWNFTLMFILRCTFPSGMNRGNILQQIKTE